MLHTLKVYLKGSHDDSKIKELNVDQYVKMNVKYNEDSDSLITLKIKPNKAGDKLLQPYQKLMITYRITKHLRNFDQYPNDVARGFNIPHMPIFY